MNLDDYIEGTFEDDHPANQKELPLTFEMVTDNLRKEEQEVIFDFIGEIEHKLTESEKRCKYQKQILDSVKDYFEILSFPLELTSDEIEKTIELGSKIKEKLGL